MNAKLIALIYIFTTVFTPGFYFSPERNSVPGWNLSMQSYTFHLFTLKESLRKTKEAEIHFIEIYPGQKLGGELGDEVFGYRLNAGQRNTIRKWAADYGVKIISSGVWVANTDEWEPIFLFAKEMGMEFITAEPALGDWNLMEKLARKYRIKVAVHNHPSETSYWNPEILLKAIGGRSNLLGACADVGHYKRMGLDPADCLRKLKGRIISLHFKDIEPKGENQTLEDVVWGQGILNTGEMLRELEKQGFKGYFTVEYEAEWENNLPSIKKSVEYFRAYPGNR